MPHMDKIQFIKWAIQMTEANSFTENISEILRLTSRYRVYENSSDATSECCTLTLNVFFYMGATFFQNSSVVLLGLIPFLWSQAVTFWKIRILFSRKSWKIGILLIKVNPNRSFIFQKSTWLQNSGFRDKFEQIDHLFYPMRSLARPHMHGLWRSSGKSHQILMPLILEICSSI